MLWTDLGPFGEVIALGDIHCAKCGEPWDSYGVRNGDMTPEEAKKFLRGEGCPCCPKKEEEKKQPSYVRQEDTEDLLNELSLNPRAAKKFSESEHAEEFLQDLVENSE